VQLPLWLLGSLWLVRCWPLQYTTCGGPGRYAARVARRHRSRYVVRGSWWAAMWHHVVARAALRGTMSWPRRGLGAAAYAATRRKYQIPVQSSFPKPSKPLLPKAELDTPPRVQSLF
jgi:hypothetical protein